MNHGILLPVEQKKIHANNGAISHSKVDIGNDAGQDRDLSALQSGLGSGNVKECECIDIR